LVGWFKGHKEVVQLLLEYDGIDVDSLYPAFNSTPLTIAVERGHEEVVRMLLEKGADFEVRDIDGRSILRIAAYNRHEMIVEMVKSKIQSARSRPDSGSPENRGLWTCFVGAG
jgi:ankyrin repeat protein